MSELIATKLFSDANLISYYRLADLTDSKGANTLTNNNSATFVSAKYGNGIKCNNTPFLSQATSFGIGSGAFSFVFFTLPLAAITAGAWEFVYCTDAGANITVDVYYEYNAGTPRLHFKRRQTSNSTPDLFYNINLSLAQFTHIAITYDGSTITGYVNGVNIGTISTSGTGTGTPPTAGFRMANDEAGNVANAIFDDCGVFTRALTATEVAMLAHDQSGLFMGGDL